MAGLESIALAVDFLERERQEVGDSPPSASLVGVQNSDDKTPMPPRSSFVNAPRRVSSDSMYGEGSRNSPVAPSLLPSQPPQDLALAETLTPEAISRMVEDLSDDGEFQGPPPAPPSPTDVITRVLDCDVLCGRGGETNHHSGNVKYRTLVKRYQPLYIMSKRRDKPLIASKIVRLVRHMGGRFLRKDKSNTWRDVGNTKAREKTSQALREGAPDLRSPQKGSADGKQMDASHPSTALGVRKETGFAREGNGMGLFARESISGEADLSHAVPSPAKKTRMDVGPMPPHGQAPLHGLPQFWGGTPHALVSGVHATPAPFVGTMSVMPAGVEVSFGKPNAAFSSLHSFAATVSADDDDSRALDEQQEAARPAPRGPRLKLLKRRLQEEERRGN